MSAVMLPFMLLTAVALAQLPATQYSSLQAVVRGLGAEQN